MRALPSSRGGGGGRTGMYSCFISGLYRKTYPEAVTLKMELPYDPTITFLRTYPKEKASKKKAQT